LDALRLNFTRCNRNRRPHLLGMRFNGLFTGHGCPGLPGNPQHPGAANPIAVNQPPGAPRHRVSATFAPGRLILVANSRIKPRAFHCGEKGSGSISLECTQKNEVTGRRKMNLTPFKPKAGRAACQNNKEPHTTEEQPRPR
jgi:hypothetical protein